MKKVLIIIMGYFIAIIYTIILVNHNIIILGIMREPENNFYILLALIGFPLVGLLFLRKEKITTVLAIVVLIAIILLPVIHALILKI